MRGLHLTADLFRCACEPALFTDRARLEEECRAAVAASGLSYVADRFYAFDGTTGEPGGVTGAVLLSESHLALHTWPEEHFVSVDVYVCNYSTDNSSKAEHLMQAMCDLFASRHVVRNRIVRGEPPDGEAPEQIVERLDDEAFFALVGRRTAARKSAYQTLELFETSRFGKLMRLDGANMTSEGDEFFYHEALVHPVAVAHEAPRTALIIGGGDGGAAEELLKHPSLQKVVLVELDHQVIELARAQLGKIHRGVFDDPRLVVRHADGARFIAKNHERFDLILLDLTDPDTPAHALYQPSFFRALHGALQSGGALCLHLGSPVFHATRFSRLVRELQRVFTEVHPYSLYIPLYGTVWGMATASDSLDPRRLSVAAAERRIAERKLRDLSYYNAEIHQALFALPNYVRKLVSPA